MSSLKCWQVLLLPQALNFEQDSPWCYFLAYIQDFALLEQQYHVFAEFGYLTVLGCFDLFFYVFDV